jgi:tryptophan synthase alpha chain
VSAADRIGDALRAANKRAGPALVAYLTAGYPNRGGFRQQLLTIAAAADVVEVGVPFTDPMADGVTIQRSSRVALEQGVTLRWILAELAALQLARTPLLLMSYLNPLLAFGQEELADAAASAGVCGFIVPDLPFDESGELRAALDGRGLALVQMVTPVTDATRMREICTVSQGFVYAVTMTGTTGRSASIPDEVIQYVDRVREVSPVPVCAGFGIRNREQVARFRGHVDGVIVGSALVEVLERGEDPAAWLRGLRA